MIRATVAYRPLNTFSTFSIWRSEEDMLGMVRGREAKLYSGHAPMENRHGLLVDLRVSVANGYAERETALDMLREHVGAHATVGADRAYDTRDFVARCREIGATPHVAQYEHARRRSAIEGRTTRHVG